MRTQSVTAFYDRMSATYDAWMLAGESTLADELNLVTQTFPRPCRILDVGCGTGRVSIPLQEKGYDVVGVDISPRMVEQATQKGLTEVHVSDFASFDYGHRVFDGIISLHAGFSYTNDTAVMVRMLDRCRDLLVPGGTLLWDSPNAELYGRERVLDWPSDGGRAKTRCFGHHVAAIQKLFGSQSFSIRCI